MSQNGPYPGPPAHPWSNGNAGGGADEAYTAPSDPWGDQPTPAAGGAAWTEPPTPMTYPQAYGADALNAAPPTWGVPPPPPPRRRNTPIVALVAVLGLLILGGLGTTAWLLIDRNHKPSVLPPTTSPTTQSNVAEPQTSEDARFVKSGQCVANQGTPQNPSMSIVPCTSGTYVVLKRIDGKTLGEADAESKCAKVPNYTKWYFYDSELDSLDFVLCLREH